MQLPRPPRCLEGGRERHTARAFEHRVDVPPLAANPVGVDVDHDVAVGRHLAPPRASGAVNATAMTNSRLASEGVMDRQSDPAPIRYDPGLVRHRAVRVVR